jgi:hypothetical protein
MYGSYALCVNIFNILQCLILGAYLSHRLASMTEVQHGRDFSIADTCTERVETDIVCV